MILQKTDNSWNYEKQINSGYLLNDNKELIKNDAFYKFDLQNEYKIEWK
jgi:hypothetical protein